MTWHNPLKHSDLPHRQVHIYKISLSVQQDLQTAILSHAEQKRAARLRIEEHRRRYIAAHAQIRQILSRYAGCHPTELEFSAGSHGKPHLQNFPRLQFNLSHSGDLGLLAVCLDHPVGIDIEQKKQNLDYEEIARRFFSPGEVNGLNATPENAREEAFYACWTRKEAYIKAVGMGLAIPLDSFDVSILPGQPVRLVDRLDPVRAAAWTIYEINPGNGFSASVAVTGKINRLACYLWDQA